MRRGGQRQFVGVDRNAAAAMADGNPFFQDSFRRKLASAQFLVVPENVAQRMIFFSEQPIDQPNGLHGFAVVSRARIDASLSLELLQNWQTSINARAAYDSEA